MVECNDMNCIQNIECLARQLRKRALEIAYHAGKNGAHLGGGLSTVEIFAALYGGILKLDVTNPYDDGRDRLIVSKGHCVLAYYAALESVGFLSSTDIASFESNGSHFHGHATRNLKNGIEFSGGSLSMGMSFAVGIAVASKKKGMSNKVYALVGDGECDEGLIWEAAMAASNYKLDNLVVIVDCNGLQYDGFTKEIMNHGSLADKFQAFGFKVSEVDGHNCHALYYALREEVQEKPLAIIAHTVKGKGVSFMENKKEWHHAVLSLQQYEQAISEL